jgi:hypothetical protein
MTQPLILICHSERSEESLTAAGEGFFATLRMTLKVVE